MCSFFVTLGGGGRPQGRAPLPARATNLARKTPPHQPTGHLAQHRFQQAPASTPLLAGRWQGLGRRQHVTAAAPTQRSLGPLAHQPPPTTSHATYRRMFPTCPPRNKQATARRQRETANSIRLRVPTDPRWKKPIHEHPRRTRIRQGTESASPNPARAVRAPRSRSNPAGLAPRVPPPRVFGAGAVHRPTSARHTRQHHHAMQ